MVDFSGWREETSSVKEKGVTADLMCERLCVASNFFNKLFLADLNPIGGAVELPAYKVGKSSKKFHAECSREFRFEVVRKTFVVGGESYFVLDDDQNEKWIFLEKKIKMLVLRWLHELRVSRMCGSQMSLAWRAP